MGSRWRRRYGRSRVQDHVHVARQDINKLSTCHVAAHRIIERGWRFGCVGWFVEQDQYVVGISDAMLEDQPLGVLVDVRYSWAGREYVYIATQQFKLKERLYSGQCTLRHVFEPP